MCCILCKKCRLCYALILRFSNNCPTSQAMQYAIYGATCVVKYYVTLIVMCCKQRCIILTNVANHVTILYTSPKFMMHHV